MNHPLTRHARATVYADLRPRIPRLVILIAAVVLMLATLSAATGTKHAEASTSQFTRLRLHLGRGRGLHPTSLRPIA
jgi:hypothetical protein